MSRPDHATSNYGWALWHLEQAPLESDPSWALVHTTAAQARAALAAIDLAEGRFEGATWSGGSLVQCVCPVSPRHCKAHPPAIHTNQHEEI